MTIRQLLVPVANIGTSIGIYMVMFGAFLGLTGLAKLGVFLFGGFVMFTVVTLPVEIDASIRAKKALLESGKIISGEEARGVRQVLTAAAATYLAAAVTSVLQLFYWAFRAGLLGGRRE